MRRTAGFADSAYSDQMEWIVPESDLVKIEIDKSVGNEVRIRVRRKIGCTLIFR